MATARRFEDLIIWQNAMNLAVQNYELFQQENLKTDFVLKNQMVRSSFSISNNIAEGFEYTSNKQFRRFLKYSKGSAGEFRNQLIFLKKIDKISENTFNGMYDKIVKLSRQIEKFRSTL